MRAAAEDRDQSIDTLIFQIELDAEDVVLGTPRSCHDDPVARAIKRAIPDLYDVSVTRRSILLMFASTSRAWGRRGPAAWVEVPTPPEVAAWLDVFDAEPSDDLDRLGFELTFHPVRDRYRAARQAGVNDANG